jgi:hypothetical protein
MLDDPTSVQLYNTHDLERLEQQLSPFPFYPFSSFAKLPFSFFGCFLGVTCQAYSLERFFILTMRNT